MGSQRAEPYRTRTRNTRDTGERKPQGHQRAQKITWLRFGEVEYLFRRRFPKNVLHLIPASPLKSLSSGENILDHKEEGKNQKSSRHKC